MGVAVKKPVKVNFLRWTGKNDRQIFNFLEGCDNNTSMTWNGKNFYIDHVKVDGGLVIKTLEGEHLASIDDVIIQGVNGEFYPCKPDIFAKTYDILDE